MVVNRTEAQIFFLFLGWRLSVAVGAVGSGNGNCKEGKTTAPSHGTLHRVSLPSFSTAAVPCTLLTECGIGMTIIKS